MAFLLTEAEFYSTINILGQLSPVLRHGRVQADGRCGATRGPPLA